MKMITKSELGQMTRDPLGGWPQPYFLPNRLNFPITLDDATWQLIMFAQGALGELSATTKLVKPSDLSFRLALLQEALASSRIEGTQATLGEVIEADLNSEIKSQEVGEVLSYQSALWLAVNQLRELPISRRLVCAAHKELLRGRQGLTKTPGEFRKTPVWVGSDDGTPQRAKFIPPLPQHLTELFADWEDFVNAESRIPLIAKLAIAHYQFETIHPFLDGNGRVGRILIEAMLIQAGVLSGPYLGVSSFIEQHRQDYYNLLQKTRETGDLKPFIRFLAFSIETQATAAVERVKSLISLREKWLLQYGSKTKSMPGLIDLLIEQPIVDVKHVKNALSISQPTAATLLKFATELKMISSRGKLGRGRRETWISEPVWAIYSPNEAP